MDLFLKGLILGLSIAAPVGPIGLLCIRRSLADGRMAGLATGLGAAAADAVYGAIAGFGLAAISGFLVAQRFWLGLLGGVYLTALGVRIFRSQPASVAAGAAGRGLSGAFFSTFALTLTNPATILSFVAVFAGLGLGGGTGVDGGGEARNSAGAAFTLVTGVFLGSAAWWLLLSSAVGGLRSRVEPAWLRGINRVSGGFLVAFGLYALLSVVR